MVKPIFDDEALISGEVGESERRVPLLTTATELEFPILRGDHHNCLKDLSLCQLWKRHLLLLHRDSAFLPEKIPQNLGFAGRRINV